MILQWALVIMLSFPEGKVNPIPFETKELCEAGKQQLLWAMQKQRWSSTYSNSSIMECVRVRS